MHMEVMDAPDIHISALTGEEDGHGEDEAHGDEHNGDDLNDFHLQLSGEFPQMVNNSAVTCRDGE